VPESGPTAERAVHSGTARWSDGARKQGEVIVREIRDLVPVKTRKIP